MKKTSFNVDEELWRRFKAACALQGKNVSTKLAELIRKFLEEEKL